MFTKRQNNNIGYIGELNLYYFISIVVPIYIVCDKRTISYYRAVYKNCKLFTEMDNTYRRKQGVNKSRILTIS